MEDPVLQKAEEPSSSSAGEGQTAEAQLPPASNDNPTLKQETNLCGQVSAQRRSNGSAEPALKKDIAESLHAPKRRRRQPEELDMPGK